MQTHKTLWKTTKTKKKAKSKENIRASKNNTFGSHTANKLKETETEKKSERKEGGKLRTKSNQAAARMKIWARNREKTKHRLKPVSGSKLVLFSSLNNTPTKRAKEFYDLVWRLKTKK